MDFPSAHHPDPEGKRWRVLLLLADRPAIQRIGALLQAQARPVDVTVAASLQEAIVYGTPRGLRLVVVDAALCDALERQFVQHLLAATASLQVVLLEDEPSSGQAPHAERLHCVLRQRLLPCVEAWAQRQARAEMS